MKRLISILALAAMTLSVSAQRVTDKLDRGLIAIKTTSGVFVNWRIQADEYYDVKYNLYKDGSKIAENLNVSNYTDASGSTSSKYTVAAVINGKEQAQCDAVTPWAQDYMQINPKHDSSLKCTYIPNDGCCADVDGDGQVEILLKYTNAEESSQLFPKQGPVVDGVSTKEYTLFEVLKLDGTVLWWVNCGPNMGDFQNNEQNIVGYDWDQDGKAEVVMRLEEGSVVHMADGTTYTIGANGKNGGSWTNYRVPKGESSVEWFTYYGKEFLFYCNGSTGQPYQCIDFPLKRLEDGETDLNAAWGDGYGHRSSKYFFGAPYLDGRHPSMFLGRGIYTRHKFIAYDVDPLTHALTTRWTWYNNSKGSPWYGEGYHNYAVVDVDWDGRDEIVWGSMVIDDNGKGLSTTGFGHGDAQHHGDFDPYTYGQEGFFCNEDKPANNYRDLTTAKIYHRVTGSNDDGRAICGQFCNVYPGAMGFSAHDVAISCVTGDAVGSLSKTGVTMNFRCYWDGDLEEESFDGGGDGGNGSIYKYGNASAIKTFTGSVSNNSTKSTPTFMGDIFGDWREEFIMRTSDNNIRIYATTIPTQNRNYSLWYDKQYRNGMVWEPCGYNQPPHASYFLGDLEGITAAPPAETMTGRTEVSDNGTISNSNETVITCETNDMTVNVADGATPYLYIDNAPSWVQGYAPSETSMSNNPNNIKYQYYTHTLTGGAFAGDMRLVKQGAGTLVLPNVTETYNGKTEVWAGSLNFDGTLANSKLWLNRLTALNSDGGTFSKGIQADYGAVIRPGGVEAKASSITTDTLALGFGAVCELDIYSDEFKADSLNAKVLSIQKKVWPSGGGPAYDTPVFRINAHAASGAEAIADGKYCLGNVGEVIGNLDNIVIENMSKQKTVLSLEDGKLYMTVTNFNGEAITWKGDKSSKWNLDKDANFTSDATGEESKFVTDSPVTFNDSAKVFNVVVDGNVSPESITFNNTKAYTLSGDSIVGNPSLTKSGTGSVTINSENRVGNTIISDGAVYVSELANTTGTDCGALGTKDKTITLRDGGTLGISESLTSNQKIICDQNEGVIDVASGKTLSQAGIVTFKNSATLKKTGAGALNISGTLATAELSITNGSMDYSGSTAYSKTINMSGSSTVSGDGFITASYNVASGAKATITLTGTYYKAYSGSLKGSGTVTINPTNKVNRVSLTGNWSAFTGTVNYTNTTILMPLKNGYGLPNATLNLGASTNVGNVAKTFTIGKLTGSGTLRHPECDFSSSSSVSGSNTWKVGNSWTGTASDNFEFAGTFYDAGGTNKCNFEKIGTCKMTLKNTTSWSNSGTVKISEGELHMATGKTLGSGALTIADGATLSGISAVTSSSAKKTPMTNSSVTVNGTLQVGSTATSTNGFIDFGGKNVTFGSTGVLRVGVLKCATSATVPGCTTIGTIGKLTMNDGATVSVFKSSSYVPTATEEKADSFMIFHDVTTASIGKVTFDLPELEEGYAWDTSKFSTGYLYVVKRKSLDVSIIRAIVNVICGGEKTGSEDVNGDGTVDVRDVNTAISRISAQ